MNTKSLKECRIVLQSIVCIFCFARFTTEDRQFPTVNFENRVIQKDSISCSRVIQNKEVMKIRGGL